MLLGKQTTEEKINKKSKGKKEKTDFFNLVTINLYSNFFLKQLSLMLRVRVRASVHIKD